MPWSNGVIAVPTNTVPTVQGKSQEFSTTGSQNSYDNAAFLLCFQSLVKHHTIIQNL